MATPVWATIGAEVVRRLPCGWRRGCRSLRLRAQLCFDRGNVFQYWRTKLVFAQEHGAGLEAWQTRTRCETLTPLILVRIHVPQPGIPVFSGVSPLAWNSATLAGLGEGIRSLFRAELALRRFLAPFWGPASAAHFGISGRLTSREAETDSTSLAKSASDRARRSTL